MKALASTVGGKVTGAVTGAMASFLTGSEANPTSAWFAAGAGGSPPDGQHGAERQRRPRDQGLANLKSDAGS